ncbi:MAG TPA: non-canonical purine NTP pyrophosphatase [Verrucomicrobiae bacterium]|nr:non-canonical purine NTP pyrophosphatase [Verrucomicrobiae bacterium]
MKIKTIVLATRNAHKTAELSVMLGKNFEVRNLQEFSNAPETIEDAPTFAGNATKKAVALARWLSESRLAREDWYVLADDSGLEVDALGGTPAVLSARFAALDTGAKGNSPDADNNAKLLRLLKKHPRPWTARFRCVLAFTPVPSADQSAASPTCYLDEAELATMIFDGACEGQIVPDAKGAHGFGYDPLFVPNGFTQTFSELGEDVKNQISHRAQAMKKFRAAVLS